MNDRFPPLLSSSLRTRNQISPTAVNYLVLVSRLGSLSLLPPFLSGGVGGGTRRSAITAVPHTNVLVELRLTRSYIFNHSLGTRPSCL